MTASQNALVWLSWYRYCNTFASIIPFAIQGQYLATFTEVSVDISFQTLFLSAIDSLVIDEADLILSYGHDNDVRQIFSGGYLSKVHQSFLMSATMTEDVEMLKGLTLRDPVSMTAFSLNGVW